MRGLATDWTLIRTRGSWISFAGCSTGWALVIGERTRPTAYATICSWGNRLLHHGQQVCPFGTYPGHWWPICQKGSLSCHLVLQSIQKTGVVQSGFQPVSIFCRAMINGEQRYTIVCLYSRINWEIIRFKPQCMGRLSNTRTLWLTQLSVSFWSCAAGTAWEWFYHKWSGLYMRWNLSKPDLPKYRPFLKSLLNNSLQIKPRKAGRPSELPNIFGPALAGLGRFHCIIHCPAFSQLA